MGRARRRGSSGITRALIVISLVLVVLATVWGLRRPPVGLPTATGSLPASFRPRTEVEAVAMRAEEAYLRIRPGMQEAERRALIANYVTALNRLGNERLEQGDSTLARSVFETARRIGPRFYTATTFNLGRLHRGLGETGRAVELFKEVLREDPAHVKALVTLGEIHLEERRDGDALEAFQRAVAHAPNDARAAHGVGRCFQRRGMFAAAAQHLKKALALQPDMGPAHANLADCEIKLKNWKGAIASAQQAIRLGLTGGPIYITLGLAMTQKGDVKGGMAMYEKARALLGQDNPLLAILRAENLMRQGQLKRARQELESAVKSQPDEHFAKLYLADAHVRLKEYKEALALYDGLIDRVNHNDRFMLGLRRGELLKELGRHQEALQSYRISGLLGLDDGEVYVRMASAYAALGDDRYAAQYFQAAKRLAKKLDAADEVLLARILARLPAHSLEQPYPVVFEDVTAAAGIAFRHHAGYPLLHLAQIIPPGVAVVDYDGDGYEDLFFTNSSDYYKRTRPPEAERSHRLFRNNGDGTFTDATRQAGLWNERFGFCAILPDVDNDGHADLLVCGLGFAELWRNNGDGTFGPLQDGIGTRFDPGNITTGPGAGDYDSDGLLDVFIPSYTVIDFAKVPERPVLVPIFEKDDKWLLPVTMRPMEYQGAPGRLLRNTGGLRLLDVSARSGAAVAGRGLQAVFADVDSDGHPDIIVAHDEEEMAYLHNNRDGTFRNLARRAWLNDARGNMGIAVGDYDWDGDLDLAITHFAEESTGFHRNEHPRPIFTEIAVGLGLEKSVGDKYEVGWGDSLVDYDNDGLLDLVWVNGHALAEKYDPKTYATTDKNLALPQKMRSFKGDGRSFTETSDATGVSKHKWVSRGLATFDLDRDGAIDLAIANNYGPAVLMRNQGTHGHWIGFELVGTRSNRQAVGARVHLSLDGKRRMREVHLGTSYFSQETLMVHYGLGEVRRVPKVEIRWPSGKVQVLRDLPADRLVRVVEPAS